METDILLDMREDSFERIGGVWNVEFRVTQVCEKVWEISLHAVVRTPKSAVRVMPFICDVIDSSLFEKLSPLVMPEFQPECKLCFINLW